jgi:hypothetical protein
MAVGLIITPAQAERIVREEQADLVLLAPHWPLKASRELDPGGGWQRWPPSWGWWLAQSERTGVDWD